MKDSASIDRRTQERLARERRRRLSQTRRTRRERRAGRKVVRR